MEIQLLAFGIARDILGQRKSIMAVDDGTTIYTLKEQLLTQHREFGRLASLQFAVNEEYVQDAYALKHGDEVVLIPPVSGG